MPENKYLYSKFHVRTPDEKPLDSGTFVMRPFNEDGSVRDQGAIKALEAYARHYQAELPKVAEAIHVWLKNPAGHEATKTLNVPESQ